MPYRPVTSRREHSSETIAVIWALHCIGYSASKIQLENGLPKSTITWILRRLRKSPGNEWKKAVRTGRPPKLDLRAERRLVRYIATNPFSTLACLGTPSKTGMRLSDNTTRRYLAKNEYYAFRPRRKPYLTKAHKLARLRFARRMQHWKLDDVACICFSDESTFEIGIDSRPPWVRRKRGQAYESRNLKPTFKSGRSAVGIWGAISMNFKSELLIVPRGARMNSQKYIGLVLNEKAHPFYQKVMEEHGDAIWQEDGAKYHTSKATRSHQAALGMVILDWPAQSPDLNPIENLWRIMKLRISQRRHRISSIQEMEAVLQEEWDRLTPADWVNVVGSFAKRCKEVIKNHGGATHY